MGNYIDKILNYNIIDVSNCISINNHNIITQKFYKNPTIWNLKNNNLILEIFKNIKTNFNNEFTNDIKISIDKVIYYELINPIINNDLESKNLALHESINGLKNNFDFNYLPELRCFYLSPLINNNKNLYFCLRRINHYLKDSINKYEIYYYFLQKILNKYFDTDIKTSNNFEFTNWSLLNVITINKYRKIKFNSNNDLVNKIKLNLNQFDNQQFYIFIDSSVNSMTLLYILNNLYPNKINAIHLHILNRTLETKLITNYCKILKCKLKTIKLFELVNFDKNMINYNHTYITKFKNKVINQLKVNNNEWDIVEYNSVMFCNNYEDNFKYLINSIINKTKMEDLIELKKNYTDENLNYFRPLIDIKNKEIIKYAKLHGIPYTSKKFNPKIYHLKNYLNNFNKDFIDGIYNLYNK